jgi:ribosome-binding factor A
VAELIKKALVQVFNSGGLFIPGLEENSITVSEVRVTPDLKIAFAYVLPLNKTIDSKTFISLLGQADKQIRFEVTKLIQIKFSPKIVFKFDDSFDRAEHLEKLFEEIRQNSAVVVTE